MMPTLRLLGTVLRSSGEWPCTSALGLFTRRYSAVRSKLAPSPKVTVSVLRSLCRRISVGQACVSLVVMARSYSAAGYFTNRARTAWRDITDAGRREFARDPGFALGP